MIKFVPQNIKEYVTKSITTVKKFGHKKKLSRIGNLDKQILDMYTLFQL